MPKVRPLAPPTLPALIIGTAAILGRTDGELAEALGISKSTFSHKKKDMLNSMSFTQVLTLCEYLHISREQFTEAVRLRTEASYGRH